MNRLLRHARFVAGRIGIAGVMGFALLAFAAALLVTSVQPLAEELATLRARADRLQAARLLAKAQRKPRADPVADVEAVLGSLPGIASAAQYVARLHTEAQTQGLQLETGEYRAATDADAGVIRYQVRLPVKGTYVQIRAFVAGAMDRIPGMTLDEFSFRRTDIALGEVEGRVQFGLLFAEVR